MTNQLARMTVVDQASLHVWKRPLEVHLEPEHRPDGFLRVKKPRLLPATAPESGCANLPVLVEKIVQRL